MTNEQEAFNPILAYCGRCKTTYTVEEPGAQCAICGSAPDWILPFYSVAELDSSEAAAGAASPPLRDAVEAPYRIKCPHCDGDVELIFGDNGVVVLPIAPPATDEGQNKEISSPDLGKASPDVSAPEGSAGRLSHPETAEPPAAPVAPASE